MRLLLISLVLLTSGISQAATYYSIGNWNSNSNSSKWSTTQGGSNCGCTPNFATDDVYVYHKVRLRYGIQVTTGSFNVMDGAQVYLNQWGGSFSVGSSASLFIEDGGKLYTYASFNNQSDDFLVEGKFDMNGGSTITNSGTILVKDGGEFETTSSHTLTNSGTFTAEDGSDLELGSITNSGSFTLDTKLKTEDWNTFNNSGDFHVQSNGEFESGSVTNSGTFTVDAEFKQKKDWNTLNNTGTIVFNQGSEVKLGTVTNSDTIKVYGEVEQHKDWNTLTNSGYVLNNGDMEVGSLSNSGVFNGNGILDYEDNVSNTGTINGCSTCSLTSPTYLANVPYNVNAKIYNASGWVNGSPGTTDAAIILADVKLNNLECKVLTVAENVNLEVKKNRTLTITDSLNIQGTITVQDGASILQGENSALTGSGQVIVERNTGALADDLRYQFWSSPVTNATMGDIFAGSNTSDFYHWNDGTQQWNSQAANAIMTPGKGYITTGTIGLNGQSEDRYFSGVLNNGDITINSSASDGQTILLGNPYPSALDAEQFILDNSGIEGTIYYWNHTSVNGNGSNSVSDYVVWNALGGVSGNLVESPSDYITTGQGFFVIAAEDNPTVEFNNGQRVDGNNLQFFKNNTDERKRIWVSVTNDSNDVASTLVGFTSDATEGNDRMYDAAIWKAHPRISMYTKLDQADFAIQAKQDLRVGENKSFELGIDAYITGSYTISFDSIMNWPAHYDVKLYDAVEDTLVDVALGATYTFNLSQTAVVSGRFFIQVSYEMEKEVATASTGVSSAAHTATSETVTLDKTATSVETEVEESKALTLTQQFNAVELKANVEFNTVMVHDVAGRMVGQTTAIGNTVRFEGIETGIHIFQIQYADGSTEVQKYFVK